jgi:hypothetical protein
MIPRKKYERSPVATALGNGMMCPPDHPVRRAVSAIVLNAITSHHYLDDAAESLGVTGAFLCGMLRRFPELKPFSSWSQKRRDLIRLKCEAARR